MLKEAPVHERPRLVDFSPDQTESDGKLMIIIITKY